MEQYRIMDADVTILSTNTFYTFFQKHDWKMQWPLKAKEQYYETKITGLAAQRQKFALLS